MSVFETIQRINDLRSEIDELRPIPPEIIDRIMRKFHLDWNFHSNSIEGNSLTFGETKAFLLHGLTAAGKPLKDHLDIKGHKKAIDELEDFIRSNSQLTEFTLKAWNKLLLVEPFEQRIEDANGNVTVRRINPGVYKSLPNYVVTATGETHYFTDPIKVRDEIEALLVRYEKDSKDDLLHSLIIASRIHYEFINIHPFDDGNGRLARILMNLVLMKNGFPPVVVRVEDKPNYLRALQQADSGDFEPFIDYIGQQLIKSLETMLKGAKGENIEEPSDLDKEIQLVLKQIEESKKDIVKAKKGGQYLLYTFRNTIFPLLQQLEKTVYKFHEFFHEIEIESIINFYVGHQKSFTDVISFIDWVNQNERGLDQIRSFIFIGRLKGYKHSIKSGNDHTFSLNFRFNDFNYEIETGAGEKKEIGLYDSKIEPRRINEICQDMGRGILDFVKNISQ
ncbi:Fic family protein [Leptospira koniambonensis]|uniref:Fic family protein n=1 Tax=Leptospira koniambonensis TaxID=2484950 RepID=A0A4R9J5Y3_9LEPT|nr:Fic family protein [Leptospira koniambonensis]TGL32358.1 Fic family protein [Leptospira koniambonensis]